MATQELYCPKDFNLGDFREDHCNVGGIPCPAPLEADPEQVVQVSCGPCGRFWGIPIDKVMKGKVSGFHSCSRAECAAKIIQSLVTFTPAPVSDISYAQGEATPVKAPDLDAKIAETQKAEAQPKPTKPRK